MEREMKTAVRASVTIKVLWMGIIVFLALYFGGDIIDLIGKFAD